MCELFMATDLSAENQTLDFTATPSRLAPTIAWRLTYGDGSESLVMARTKRAAVERGESRRPGEWVIRAEEA